MDSRYVGRFAPSPTGPLHFGSLLAALASFLDARAHGGKWLLRIEDLDPPREPAGAADTIKAQLDRFGLHWDDEPLYQSKRQDAYSDALHQLHLAGLTFRCDCSRPRLKQNGGWYDGRCRSRQLQDSGSYAIRFRSGDTTVEFDDQIQGHKSLSAADYGGDFVIKRKDGLFAYQLAVVVDDAWQGVNQVLRGIDLLDSTPRQILLQRSLSLPTPGYAHIPVVVDAQGHKLSKQQFADPVDTSSPQKTLIRALRGLGQDASTDMAKASVEHLLEQAISRWDIQRVPSLATIGDEVD